MKIQLGRTVRISSIVCRLSHVSLSCLRFITAGFLSRVSSDTSQLDSELPRRVFMGINEILLNSSMYLLVYLNSLNISSETFPLRICSAPGKPANRAREGAYGSETTCVCALVAAKLTFHLVHATQHLVLPF